MEAELGGKQTAAKEPWSQQDVEEAGRLLPWILHREHSPVALFWTCGLQSYENINVCCCKSPSFRCFVVTASKCSYIKRELTVPDPHPTYPPSK